MYIERAIAAKPHNHHDCITIYNRHFLKICISPIKSCMHALRCIQMHSGNLLLNPKPISVHVIFVFLCRKVVLSSLCGPKGSLKLLLKNMFLIVVFNFWEICGNSGTWNHLILDLDLSIAKLKIVRNKPILTIDRNVARAFMSNVSF